MVLAGRDRSSSAEPAAHNTCHSQKAHSGWRARFGVAGICTASTESRTDDGLRVGPERALAVRAQRQRCAGFWGRGGDQAARLMDRPGRAPSLLRQRSALRYAATVAQVGEALLERTRARLLGLGEVQAMAGLGGSLLGQDRPGNVDCCVPGDGGLTVGVERIGEVVGPARCGPVAGIGAVGAGAGGGPYLGPERVAPGLVTTTMV